jgi:recombination protein RecA
MSNTFDLIKEKLEKAAKGDRMMILSESENAAPIVYIPTEAYDLNRILSGSLYHGVASRTHTLLVGPEASGKSSFMCLNLAAAQKMGYTPVVIDAEGAWTKKFCERWGIDTTRAFIISTPWVEEIMIELAKIIDEGWTRLAIAFDSIGAVESLKMIDDVTGKGKRGEVVADQGGLQKKIKRLMKMLVDITKRQDSVSYSAGHYYGNPTGYGEPEKIGGGFYPRLAADYIITLKKALIHENPTAKTAAEKGDVVGTRIYAATIKNRYAPPFQEAVFEISYHNGVQRLAGIIDVAKEMGIIDQSGAWYTVPCLGIKSQGQGNLEKDLENVDIQPLFDEIEKILEGRGYSSAKDELKVLADVVDGVTPTEVLS